MNTGYALPVDPVQSFLIVVWKELLGIEYIGVNDSFFTLGGHYLKATQLISRIAEKYSIEMDLNELYDANTVSLLAETIKNKLARLLENMSAQGANEYLVT